MRRRKNTLRNIILVILLIILGVLIVCVFKDKKIDNNTNENSNSQKINNTTNNTNKTNNNENTTTNKENDISTSEPKKDEESETKQQLQNNVTVNIELIGSEEITLNVGDTYKELGYKATDSNGKDVSSEVNIQNNVDTSKKGEYMVIYSIGKSMVIRNVIVK